MTDDKPCSVSQCSKLINPQLGGCCRCRLDFCETHRFGADNQHPRCFENPPDEILDQILADSAAVEFRKIVQRLETVDLKGIAESRRPGHTCTVRLPTSFDRETTLAGGYHIHILIQFEDGIKWLARIRQIASYLMRPGEDRMMTESEVTTQHLLSRGGLKVPDAWPVEECLTNGLDICFVEHISGRSRPERLDMKDDTTLNTIRDFARFSIQLSEWAFPKIGSLFSDVRLAQGDQIRNPTASKLGSPLYIGPFINQDHHLTGPPYFPGPFRTMAAGYSAHIDQCLRAILDGSRYELDPIPNYLAQLELRQMIKNDVGLSRPVNGTYIAHGDMSGCNIMEDQKGDLMGIIDWDWAHLTAKEEAFAGPLAFLDDEAFSEGSNHLSEAEEALSKAYDDLGRTDLGDCVRYGKKYQQLQYCVGQGCPEWPMFKAIAESFGYSSFPDEEAIWQNQAEKKFESDEGLRGLMKGRV